MEKFESYEKKSEQITSADALEKLRCVADILREMGLKVLDEFLVEDFLVSGRTFPIVRDRLDGIRASYTKQRGLIISFTNGFENPNDPERQEIERRLKEVDERIVPS